MPEQKLNPEALEPLYGLAKLCIRYLNRDDCPETVSRLRAAIALAESTPEQQPPSGFMTMERAREIAKTVLCYKLCGIKDCPRCNDLRGKSLLNTDRAARLETLKCAMYKTVSAIECRLKELEHAD